MRARFIISALVAMVGLAACVAWALGVFEPRYDGVPASTYFQNLFSAHSFGGKEGKERVLAVPARVGVSILIRMTQAQDPRWRGWYQRLYPKLPQFIARRLGPPKPNDLTVVRAVMALGYYGRDAAPAVPQLLKLEAAAKTPFIQFHAINALGDIGPAASNAIPMLVTHFQSRAMTLADAAVRALGKIDSRGERSGALIVSAIENGHTEPGSLEALSRMAAHEPKWVEEIWRLMQKSLTAQTPLSFDFLRNGAACLEELHTLDAGRVQIICGYSESTVPPIRQSVAEALAYATQHAQTTIPVLQKLLIDGKLTVSAAACSTLLRYAQNTNIAVNLRVKAVRAAISCTSDVGNRWHALAAAQSLGHAAAPALDEIRLWLSDPNERIRGKAADAVSAMGTAAGPAKSALEPLLKDRWGFVRDAAQAALSNIAAGATSP